MSGQTQSGKNIFDLNVKNDFDLVLMDLKQIDRHIILFYTIICRMLITFNPGSVAPIPQQIPSVLCQLQL